MLSPEYLDSIEFNDVVELYNKLNIDITADIIERVSQMQDITETTLNQLRILKQTNGKEVFNSALEKTSMLTSETKKRLKKLFKDMAKEDIQGYKELFKYRDKLFKLNETQYMILNQGLKQTNKTLKNFTNTIAFQSKQIYVEAIDEAYMNVLSGAFDYQSAINNTCQNLAEKGITLKDKLGRNVQLEVAVRRNIMYGIQSTANNINKDLDNYLGCDGYEVTAHTGARPSHAEAQGKQYAINKKDADKYGIGLWSDVSDLWEEYNCRHTYFGIILGISEPQYTDKELKEMKDAKVNFNGKEMSYYEGTQKQRQLENAIRKQKRAVQTLEKANIDSTISKSKLAKLQKQYKDFCKETGLEKDYGRIKVADTTKNYIDITKEMYNDRKTGKVKAQNFLEKDGVIYKVKGKDVVFNPDENEKRCAKVLAKIFGENVILLPKVNNPQGIKSADYLFKNEFLDLKTINKSNKKQLSKDSIYNSLKKCQKQSNNFVIDITNYTYEKDVAYKQIEKIYNSGHRNWVDTIYLMENDKIIKIFKRKK